MLSAIKTEVSLDCDDPTNQNFVLQQYEERIERLSQQDKVSKFCMDARFLSVVEIGQYFMTTATADFHNFMQWPVVNTLFQGKKVHHNQEDGSRETQKIGPVLEVTTSCLHGTCSRDINLVSERRQFSLLD